jgi:hypothetical protein
VVTASTNVSITNTISAMLNDCTTLELLEAIDAFFPVFRQFRDRQTPAQHRRMKPR